MHLGGSCMHVCSCTRVSVKNKLYRTLFARFFVVQGFIYLFHSSIEELDRGVSLLARPSQLLQCSLLDFLAEPLQKNIICSNVVVRVQLKVTPKLVYTILRLPYDMRHARTPAILDLQCRYDA